ncbi:MAG: delta-60 repeat domain-containing protein [Candidatus Doudnabacteria bacterium]|nr:delta-60 repeat domain-containing protein [Candidatus Doudnabacteria bacterium]
MNINLKHIQKLTASVIVLAIVFGLGALTAKFYRPIVEAAPNDPLATTVTVNDDVFAVEVTATKIYIGGNFTQVNGVGRNYLAALNLDGTLDASWDPNVDDTVLAIYATDTAVYAGGNFGTVNGATTRSRAAAFSIANGVNTGTATAWDPELDGNVLAITGSGTKIYLGGEFTDVNAGTTRNSIAAVDSTTGAVDAAWNPNLSGAVEEILINDSKVYAVGLFDNVNGLTPRGYGAAFNLADGADVGTALAWNPATNGDVDDIAFYNNQIYIVGEFTQVGVELINYAARVHPTTGAIDNSWDPEADGSIFAISISDDGNIFLGGAFDNLGGVDHKWVGLVDSTDGSASSWDPVLRIAVIDTVYDLGISDTTVAVVGDFNRVNGSADHANFAQFEFPEIEFTASTSNGLESATAVNIEVSLDFAADIDTTVAYAVTGGTATGAGTDYTLASGTATILATETTVDIATTVVSDLTDEVDETIIITLTNPTNAFLGTNTTHTYTITDDDEAISAGGSSSGSKAVSSESHPQGTVINIDGTLYTIMKNNQNQVVRRPYTSAGAFLSYGFNSFGIVVEASEADKNLNVGDFIPPQDGRVVCSDRGSDLGTCYLITNRQKAGFVSEDVFAGSGFSFENAIYGDISFLSTTSNIETASQAHLPGTIILNNNTIQLVSNSGLLGFPSFETFLSWGYDLSMVIPSNSFDTSLVQNSVVGLRQAGQILMSY